MWGLESRTEKNSSAAKQAAFPALTRTAGKAPSRSFQESESAVFGRSSKSAIKDTYNILYRNLNHAPDL